MKHSLGYFDYETGQTTVAYRDNNKFTLDENECKPVPPAKVCVCMYFMYVPTLCMYALYVCIFIYACTDVCMFMDFLNL